MPILDGFGAAKKIRQNKYEGPIIALTADATKVQEKKCLDSGFSAYYTKPISLEIFTHILQFYTIKRNEVQNIVDN